MNIQHLLRLIAHENQWGHAVTTQNTLFVCGKRKASDFDALVSLVEVSRESLDGDVGDQIDLEVQACSGISVSKEEAEAVCALIKQFTDNTHMLHGEENCPLHKVHLRFPQQISEANLDISLRFVRENVGKAWNQCMLAFPRIISGMCETPSLITLGSLEYPLTCKELQDMEHHGTA